ncbi:MAG: T9SS type A sorting domain-containing protein [Bacteroidota bacterium]|nr:T9SS type A sorting domain-containing protein [Bacteroidota bacterium]
MSKFFSTLLFVMILCMIPTRMYSQSRVTIFGETVLADISRRIDRGAYENIHHLYYTEKECGVASITTRLFGGDDGGSGVVVKAPFEKKIVSANFKSDNPDIAFVLFSNGMVTVLKYIQTQLGSHWEVGATIPITVIGFPIFNKIIGDAVYALGSGKVYASWDTAKTWLLDTTNIGSESVNDIAVDTNHYGWVVTESRNLYYQHPDSNIWRKDTSFKTTGFPRKIFVDRKGRMFIYTTASVAQGRVVMSTDGGVTFTNISSGVVEGIASFGDDAFGNIYAVGTSSGAYRLSNLTPPWESISDSLNAQKYLPSSEKIINTISGDSVLFASTKYGMFQSTNFGTNWVHSPISSQSRAHNFYTGVVKGGNYYFISTNLGIYRVAVGDTISEKVFPKQGFVWGINVITSDSVGNVYGNLPIKTGPSSWLFYTVKSTDHGDTWIPDTAGQKALGITAGTQTYDFWVDRQGTQYLGGNARFLTKKPGQAWKLDTAGLGMQANQYIKAVTLNNKKGIIYVSRVVFSGSLKLFIYSKTINDSAWKIVNTSILAAGDGILSSDQDGNIMVKAFSSPEKIWRYNGSTWAETPLPTTIGSSPSPYPLTIDKNGVIWAVFFAGGSNKGVHFTTDNGTTWKYVGLNGVGIKFLNAVDDSSTSFMKSSGSSSLPGVYAVTFIDGVYRFTTASEPTSVENTKPQIADSYELFQNYPNPFNPTTTIRFMLQTSGFTSLKVHDILGREVAVLINEERNAGLHSVQFDASKLSTGVYIYSLKTGNYSASRKLLLLK